MGTATSTPSRLGRIKELTDQLTKEESMVATFFQICPDMLCVIDLKGLFIEVNGSCEKVVHWSKEQILSEYLVTFIHPKDVAETHRIIKSLKQSQIVRFYNRFKTKSGDHKPLEWTATLGVDGNIYASARVIPQGCFECERAKTEFS